MPHRLLSSCGDWGLLSRCSVQASPCGGFSCLRAQALRHRGFSSCGSQALEHRLNSCGTWAQLLHCMWDLSGPGIESMSPARAGGFFTTEIFPAVCYATSSSLLQWYPWMPGLSCLYPSPGGWEEISGLKPRILALNLPKPHSRHWANPSPYGALVFPSME